MQRKCLAATSNSGTQSEFALHLLETLQTSVSKFGFHVTENVLNEHWTSMLWNLTKWPSLLCYRFRTKSEASYPTKSGSSLPKARSPHLKLPFLST